MLRAPASVAGAYRAAMAHPSRPLVLAHRGACRKAPENTVEAFGLARELGADGAELDVRRTADGVLVVNHDPEVDGVGLVALVDFEELRAGAPSVPTLEEALDALEGLVVNLEIKCLPWEPDADADATVARAVVALVAQRALFDRAVVSSFDLATVDAVRALDPRVSTGWLTMGLDPEVTLPIAQERGHPWLHPDAGTADAASASAIAARARDLGIRLDVWTVDDPEHIAALAAASVDALITNEPDVALAVLDR